MGKAHELRGASFSEEWEPRIRRIWMKKVVGTGQRWQEVW